MSSSVEKRTLPEGREPMVGTCLWHGIPQRPEPHPNELLWSMVRAHKKTSHDIANAMPGVFEPDAGIRVEVVGALAYALTIKGLTEPIVNDRASRGDITQIGDIIGHLSTNVQTITHPDWVLLKAMEEERTAIDRVLAQKFLPNIPRVEVIGQTDRMANDSLSRNAVEGLLNKIQGRLGDTVSIELGSGHAFPLEATLKDIIFKYLVPQHLKPRQGESGSAEKIDRLVRYAMYEMALIMKKVMTGALVYLPQKEAQYLPITKKVAELIGEHAVAKEIERYIVVSETIQGKKLPPRISELSRVKVYTSKGLARERENQSISSTEAYRYAYPGAGFAFEHTADDMLEILTHPDVAVRDGLVQREFLQRQAQALALMREMKGEQISQPVKAILAIDPNATYDLGGDTRARDFVQELDGDVHGPVREAMAQLPETTKMNETARKVERATPVGGTHIEVTPEGEGTTNGQ